MKKVLLFAVVALTTLGAVSCTRDNDSTRTYQQKPEEKKTPSILGTWKLSSVDGKDVSAENRSFTLNADGSYTSEGKELQSLMGSGKYVFNGVDSAIFVVVSPEEHKGYTFAIKVVKLGEDEISYETYDPSGTNDKKSITVAKRVK
ncbi:MAG: hypothetical protein Q4A00_04465 [Flavobacteriaceae bacterium]|nr:hypothetical protein [Flavobacteriaceae bacterium]